MLMLRRVWAVVALRFPYKPLSVHAVAIGSNGSCSRLHLRQLFCFSALTYVVPFR